MATEEIQAIWNKYTVLELALFCAISHCEIELNDGQLIRITCKSRRCRNEN